MKTDVVIIGGGISGLFLAKLLEEQGIDYFLFEKNKNIGKYGNRIINKDVAKKLKLSKEDVVRPINRINFVSPSEMVLSINDKETRGYVIRLGDVENIVYKSLNNDNIFLDSYVSNLNVNDGSVSVHFPSGHDIAKAKVIINATGVHPNNVKDILQISSPRTVFCYTVEVYANDHITTILDNVLAHGFYGWIIPLEKNIIELGFGTDMIKRIKNVNLEKRLFSFPYLKKYIKSKKIKHSSGFIPTSIVNEKSGNNWINIGDASGGEPMMGGSIHKSIDEAEIALKVIKSFLDGEIKSLNEYTNIWDKLFGDEMQEQVRMRKLLDNSTNGELDAVFGAIKNKNISGKGLINDLFRNIMKNLAEMKTAS